MCYSAQIWADYHRYVRQFGATVDIAEFARLYEQRNRGGKIRTPRAMDAAFAKSATPEGQAIHKLIASWNETQEAELQQELQAVHGQVREYLQRNGVAFAVADLMMTVPNRDLRLLTDEELDRYGLSGQNAVADDLQRIRLAQKCGESFVRRKEAFFRAFDRECRAGEDEVGAMGECGVELRSRFGFPDQQCPAESPLSEYDTALASGSGRDGGKRS